MSINLPIVLIIDVSRDLLKAVPLGDAHHAVGEDALRPLACGGAIALPARTGPRGPGCGLVPQKARRPAPAVVRLPHRDGHEDPVEMRCDIKFDVGYFTLHLA